MFWILSIIFRASSKKTLNINKKSLKIKYYNSIIFKFVFVEFDINQISNKLIMINSF